MEYRKLLLSPRHTLSEEHNDSKKFFLAGPILGGRNWQRDAASALWQKVPNCVVIDPSANSENALCDTDVTYCGKLNIALYPDDQIDWEKDYMNMTGNNRGLIFWLENESLDDPKDRSLGVYAQNTRVELGRCIERAKLVPGFDFQVGYNPAYHPKTTFGGIHFLKRHLIDCDKRPIAASNVAEFISIIL